MLLQSFEATIRSPHGNGRKDEITILTVNEQQYWRYDAMTTNEARWTLQNGIQYRTYNPFYNLK